MAFETGVIHADDDGGDEEDDEDDDDDDEDDADDEDGDDEDDEDAVDGVDVDFLLAFLPLIGFRLAEGLTTASGSWSDSKKQNSPMKPCAISRHSHVLVSSEKKLENAPPARSRQISTPVLL